MAKLVVAFGDAGFGDDTRKDTAAIGKGTDGPLELIIGANT